MGPRNAVKRQALPRFMSFHVGRAEAPLVKGRHACSSAAAEEQGIFRFLCDTWYLQNHSLTETPSGHPWLRPRVDNSNQRAEHPHNNNGTRCLDLRVKTQTTVKTVCLLQKPVTSEVDSGKTDVVESQNKDFEIAITYMFRDLREDLPS